LNAIPAHIERIVAAEPEDLWLSVTPESGRRLVLAALEEFGTAGFAATNTRSIAARAGLSPAGLFIHFSSKLDLLERILLRAYESIWDAVTEALAGREDPGDRLRTLAEALTAWHAVNPALGRIVHHESHAVPPERNGESSGLALRLERLVQHELRASTWPAGIRPRAT
jgi:AcrR family transcriptional regulator